MTEEYLKLQNGSDIRGVAMDGIEGEKVNLTPKKASEIAGGFLIWLCEKTGKKPHEIRTAIGMDPRLTGPKLKEGFKDGLLPFGADVLDCGLSSTPAMFMSTVFEETKCDGAIMITASHLPFNRNGFKFFSREGGLNKENITEILKSAAESGVTADKLAKLNAGLKAEVTGKTEETDLMGLYCAHMRNVIRDGILKEYKGADKEKPLKGMKITVDAGNGSGGFYATEILEPLGADTSGSQFLDPDGNFPNHEPNPENRKAMESISEAVKKEKSDLGLIFDTDVDRSAAVNSKGKEIARNGIVAMAAALVSEDHPGTTIVTDSITSDQLTSFLEEDLKLKHFRFKRGYRNVINKAIELNEKGQDAQLAIETSGHAALKENYFLDDGAYLAAKIVIKAALLFREGKKIDSVTEALEEPAEAAEARLKITCEDFGEVGDKVLRELSEKVEEEKCFDTACSEFAPDGKVRCERVTPNYEGVRIRFLKDGKSFGWCLLRKSLHDPLLPLNIEADEEGGTGTISRAVYGFLRNYSDLDLEPLEKLFLE